ncbi:hypothetical protein OSTOST_09536, partial [Ostertagia ostertagi]
GSEEDKYKAARNILKQTPLVASTCHYVPRDVLFSWRKFDYCIIDEASMVLEPVPLSAEAAASRFVLVGDAHQLSPLVQNRKCSTIAKLSSNLFYGSRLVCANEKVAQACLAKSADFKTSSRDGVLQAYHSNHSDFTSPSSSSKRGVRDSRPNYRAPSGQAQINKNERSSMRAEGGQRRNVGNRRRNDSINSTQSECLPQTSDRLHIDTNVETRSVAGDAV